MAQPRRQFCWFPVEKPEKAAPKALPFRNCEHMHARTANTPWWSWGESNPRPSKGDRACYDHSRDCGSWLPPHRVGWARRPRHGVFPPGRRSFTPSAVCPSCLHRFCCRVAVDRPRVPLPVAMTLYRLTRSGGESEIVRIGVSVGAPFLESGQLRSHVTTTAIGVETDQPRGWWPEGHRVQISGALLSSIRTIKGTASP